MPDICYLCLAAPKAVKVPGYAVQVCSDCWRRAENGWKKDNEASLFDALRRAGLLIPDRNEQGLLPRVYQPPADFNI